MQLRTLQAWLCPGLFLVFFRPAESPPFSHGSFQTRPQEVGSLRQAFPMKLCTTQRTQYPGGRRGLIPYKRLVGCAAGCGRIFTTGLTIMESHIFGFLGIRL